MQIESYSMGKKVPTYVNIITFDKGQQIESYFPITSQFFKFKYDDDNQMLEKVVHHESGYDSTRYAYTYDSLHKNLLEKYVIKKGHKHITNRYVYSSDGEKIEEFNYSIPNSELFLHTKWVFDESGHLIEKEKEQLFPVYSKKKL